MIVRRMLVMMKPVAKIEVARVSKLAVPRTVINPPRLDEPPPPINPPPSDEVRWIKITPISAIAKSTWMTSKVAAIEGSLEMYDGTK